MPRPLLADAAGHLSEQLHDHLRRLARLLGPHAATLEARFERRLARLRFNEKQRKALSAITTGAAALALTQGRTLRDFIEQVDYSGRRLAKLKLPPQGILEALREYDYLLSPFLQRRAPEAFANLQWAREHLQFSVMITLNNAFYQVREQETQVFFELLGSELESAALEELLERFLVTLIRFCRAEAGILLVLDQDTGRLVHQAGAGPGPEDRRLPLQEAAKVRLTDRSRLARPRFIREGNGRSELVLHPAWAGRFRSYWSVPLREHGRPAGLMQFGFAAEYEWLPRELDLLAAAGERCLQAAEKAHLTQDLARRENQVRQLAERLVEVEEAERRRISTELHDEAGQSLLCLRLQLELLENAAAQTAPGMAGSLREARELAEGTILEIRRLISALSPNALEQLGLRAAIRQLVTRFRQACPARVDLRLDPLPHLPKQTEAVAYRLVQECLHNISKHSSAARVNVSLTSADGRLSLRVEDDGVGFQVDQALAGSGTFGLSGIQERVKLLGGECAIRSAPGKGTQVNIALPAPEPVELPAPA